MSNRQDQIKEQIADQMALQDHVLEAIERQRGDAEVLKNVEANKVIIEADRVLKEHIAELKTIAREYNAEGESSIKKAVAEVLGVAAGLYDKMRDYKVSRMLRDDYTAFSLVAMGYTSFHAFSLTVGEPRLAELAVRHLKDVTPVLVEISRVLPVVVVDETAREIGTGVDATVGARAVQDTQAAWDRSVVQSPAV